MLAILTGVRWNLNLHFGFDLHFLWPGMVSIFSCTFWPFGLLPLKKFCLVQFSTSSLVH
jgi:hypothetical protein